MGALPTSSAWGIIDFSSLRRELIDFHCYLRGFNAPVTCHVFFSFDFSRTVVVNVWPFELCLDHLVLVVV